LRCSVFLSSAPCRALSPLPLLVIPAHPWPGRGERFGYEFPYWFKRAFGARVRCGRRFAPSSRTPTLRLREHPNKLLYPSRCGRLTAEFDYPDCPRNPLTSEPPTRSTTMRTPVSEVKGAPRRWRDGLRPPLTPDTDEQ
jgi:hypothetical protein